MKKKKKKKKGILLIKNIVFAAGQIITYNGVFSQLCKKIKSEQLEGNQQYTNEWRDWVWHLVLLFYERNVLFFIMVQWGHVQIVKKIGQLRNLNYFLATSSKRKFAIIVRFQKYIPYSYVGKMKMKKKKKIYSRIRRLYNDRLLSKKQPSTILKFFPKDWAKPKSVIEIYAVCSCAIFLFSFFPVSNNENAETKYINSNLLQKRNHSIKDKNYNS